MDITEQLQILLVKKWIDKPKYNLVNYPYLTDSQQWWIPTYRSLKNDTI